jgi:flagellar protein FlaG
MRIESLTVGGVTASAPVAPTNRPGAEGPGQRPETKTDASPSDQAGQDQDRELEKAVRELDEAAKPLNISVEFSRDQETGSIVIKMVNATTGEKLRQIPAEATLQLAAALGKLQGRVFDRKA